MFVVGNFLKAVAGLLDIILQGLLIVILINAVLSWVQLGQLGSPNPIVMFLARVSDFVCDPLRRLFPTVFGGIDFAPFIAMLVIFFIQQFVVESLRGMALRMG
jgi:YggT family protein